jgi:hypothetical protein
MGRAGISNAFNCPESSHPGLRVRNLMEVGAGSTENASSPKKVQLRAVIPLTDEVSQ